MHMYLCIYTSVLAIALLARASEATRTRGSCCARGSAWGVLGEWHIHVVKASSPAVVQQHSQIILAAAQAGARCPLPSWPAS